MVEHSLYLLGFDGIWQLTPESFGWRSPHDNFYLILQKLKDDSSA